MLYWQRWRIQQHIYYTQSYFDMPSLYMNVSVFICVAPFSRKNRKSPQNFRDLYRLMGITIFFYFQIMKPLLERKRRARINKCLDELKDIMTAALTSQGENVSKLEKADILELTVRHLNKMQQARRILISSSRNPLEEIHRFQAGFSSCAQEAAQFLMSSPGVDAECGQRLLAHLSKVSTGSSDPAGVPMPPSAAAGVPMPPSTFQPPSSLDSPFSRRRSSSASSSTPLLSSSAESMLLAGLSSSDMMTSPSSRPASSMTSSPKLSPEPEKKKARLLEESAVKEECPDDDTEDEDDAEEQEDESFVSGRFDVKVKPVKPAPVRPSSAAQGGNSPSDPVWRPFWYFMQKWNVF